MLIELQDAIDKWMYITVEELMLSTLWSKSFNDNLETYSEEWVTKAINLSSVKINDWTGGYIGYTDNIEALPENQQIAIKWATAIYTLHWLSKGTENVLSSIQFSQSSQSFSMQPPNDSQFVPDEVQKILISAGLYKNMNFANLITTWKNSKTTDFTYDLGSDYVILEWLLKNYIKKGNFLSTSGNILIENIGSENNPGLNFDISTTNFDLRYLLVNSKGAANGVATLDEGGMVPLIQIPDSIRGGMTYKGLFDAQTALPTPIANKGNYYIVNNAGNWNTLTLAVKDWIVYNGTTWDKIDNLDQVASVNGKIGNVILTKNDIGLDQVDNTKDYSKPLSDATIAALAMKQTDLISGLNLKTVNSISLLASGDLIINKSFIGLDQVDNTSDLNKPLSNATIDALATKTAQINLTNEITARTQADIAIDNKINKGYYWKLLTITGSTTRAVAITGGLIVGQTYRIGFTWSNSSLGNITYREYLHLNNNNVAIDRYIHSSVLGLLPNVLQIGNNAASGFIITVPIGTQISDGFIISVEIKTALNL